MADKVDLEKLPPGARAALVFGLLGVIGGAAGVIWATINGTVPVLADRNYSPCPPWR